MKLKLSLLLTLILSATSARAEWIDFAGWDHDQITSSGQTFEDVCGDIDLTVTGVANSFITSFKGIDDVFIGGNSDVLELTFTFSGAVNAKMDIHTLDPDEILTITGGNPATYNHIFGAMPTQSGDLVLNGTAYGVSPTGASYGEIDLGEITTFSFTYEATSDHKFDRFGIACEVVPEPASLVLVLIGGLAMLLGRRR